MQGTDFDSVKFLLGYQHVLGYEVRAVDMVPVNVGTVPVSSFLFPEKYLECSHVTLLQDCKYVVILLQRSGGTWYKYLAIPHQAGDYDMLISKFVERADGASEDSRIADMEFGNIRLPRKVP